jgi:hypothetical protein
MKRTVTVSARILVPSQHDSDDFNTQNDEIFSFSILFDGVVG